MVDIPIELPYHIHQPLVDHSRGSLGRAHAMTGKDFEEQCDNQGLAPGGPRPPRGGTEEMLIF